VSEKNKNPNRDSQLMRNHKKIVSVVLSGGMLSDVKKSNEKRKRSKDEINKTEIAK
jgi:hypothetical protein